MRKRSRAFLVAVTGLLLLAAPAIRAEEAKSWIPGSFTGNIAILSDYSDRGMSQTNQNLAVQGGIDWTHDNGAFVGLWASNVDYGDGDIEQDIYGGYAGSMGNFAYDTVAYFFYYPKVEEFNVSVRGTAYRAPLQNGGES